MDGYEATLAILKGECGKDMIDIPIIAVTADATDRAKRKVLEVGMDEYISKTMDKVRMSSIPRSMLALRPKKSV